MYTSPSVFVKYVFGMLIRTYTYRVRQNCLDTQNLLISLSVIIHLDAQDISYVTR